MISFLMDQFGAMSNIYGANNGNNNNNNGGSPPPPPSNNGSTTSPSSTASDDCLEALRTFDLKPKEVVEYLDRFVIQQYDAKKVLAVAICDHYNHCRRCLQEDEEEQQRQQQREENDGTSMEELFAASDTQSATRTEYAKPNVLLTGPTGVGKTYLLKCLARLVGVPFVKADATKFSETGIVGRDAEDLVRDLVDAAGGNTTLASMGIVYVDEVDKICGGGGEGTTTRGGSFNKQGVQNNLLKLLEETDVNLERQGEMTFKLPAALGGSDDAGKEKTINTKNILFIFSGAFTSLDKDMRQKREKKPFGIEIDSKPSSSSSQSINSNTSLNPMTIDNNEEDDDINRPAGKGQSYLRYAQTSDFIRAGLEPEFIGRIPVRVALNSLTPSDLRQILTSAEGSVLHQFTRDFEGYGIQMDTTGDGSDGNGDDALEEIAIMAAEEGTGARGLVTILERTLREHKFELPSSSLKRFVLDVETVRRPKSALYRLLSEETPGDGAGVALEDLKRWENKMHRASKLPDKVRVWLTEEAQNTLIIESIEADVSAYSLAGRRFGDSLGKVIMRVHELTGQTAFPISMAMAKDPEVELRKWLGLLEGYSPDTVLNGSSSLIGNDMQDS